MYQAALPHLPLLEAGCVRASVVKYVCQSVLHCVGGLYDWLRELYEYQHVTDFHKHDVYRSGRAWAKASDFFGRTLSRVGRCCSAAVNLVVGFECGGISSVFVLSFLRKHTTNCKYEAALPYLPRRYDTFVVSHSCCFFF